MLDAYGTGLDPLPPEEVLGVPLVAVFPHPLHGRLIERVVLMVSNTINFKGTRYKYSWKHNGEVYYTPKAPESETESLGRIAPYPGEDD